MSDATNGHEAQEGRQGRPGTYVRMVFPGGSPRIFTDLIVDYTGTLSLDGLLLSGMTERLTQISKIIRITVLTADTFGQARSQLERLPVEVRIVKTGEDKAEFVRKLEAEHVIAIGNGRNDVAMMKLAGLGIAVIGPEGAAGDLLRVADLVVRDIRNALDLIANPVRMVATLRD